VRKKKLERREQQKRRMRKKNMTAGTLGGLKFVEGRTFLKLKKIFFFRGGGGNYKEKKKEKLGEESIVNFGVTLRERMRWLTEGDINEFVGLMILSTSKQGGHKERTRKKGPSSARRFSGIELGTRKKGRQHRGPIWSRAKKKVET